jgi:hypothetical protein
MHRVFLFTWSLDCGRQPSYTAHELIRSNKKKILYIEKLRERTNQLPLLSTLWCSRIGADSRGELVD